MNSTLDWASRNRLPLIAAVAALAVVVAAYAQSVPVAAGICAAMAAGAVLTVMSLGWRRAREERAQAQYDMRALQNELDEARAGDPSAPTVQLRTIGEGGERT
jgi:Flp pilus assembly protein TadB